MTQIADGHTFISGALALSRAAELIKCVTTKATFAIDGKGYTVEAMNFSKVPHFNSPLCEAELRPL